MDLSHWETEITTALHDMISQWNLSVMIKTVATVILLAAAIQAAKLLLLALVKGHISLQARLVVNKLFGYGGFVAVTLVFFDSLGVKLTAVLGAAGILGIAAGFAAQSSLSNVVAGLFLLGEKPFSVGDVINTADVTGIVLSVDILSVKLKTFDNTLVRIPNELLAKAKIVNITRFPIRRLDVTVTISFQENLGRVREVLKEIVAANPLALVNPEPLIVVQSFTASGIELVIGAWFEKNDYLALKNSLLTELLDRFRQENIALALPQVVVHDAGQAP